MGVRNVHRLPDRIRSRIRSPMSRPHVFAHPPFRHGMTSRERREAWEAVLFLSPWIVGFVCFTAGPVLFSLGLSFFKWDAIHAAKFRGLGNYRQMLHDPLLTKSLWNTIVY